MPRKFRASDTVGQLMKVSAVTLFPTWPQTEEVEHIGDKITNYIPVDEMACFSVCNIDLTRSKLKVDTEILIWIR